MSFSVRIAYRAGGNPALEGTRTVSRSRITIGRASDCDIVLDDPKRFVSRVHAVAVSRDGGYVLSVVSKVNAVEVNGRPFGPNTSTAVKPGDRIGIGEFDLEVLAEPVKEAPHAQTVAIDASIGPLIKARTETKAAPAARPKSLIESLSAEDAVPVAATRPAAPQPKARDAQALVQAFLKGAGLDGLEPSATPEELMRESGALLRATIEGIIGLLMARAEMKKEMRAEDRTMVSSHDNNPLKLMTDAQEALGYLLDPQAPEGAFLAPRRAVKDACDELRTHELALMAAMRAAIMGAIERFNPARIEDELIRTRGGMTLNRKAALWDLFVANQAKLLRETEDDFNKVFAQEFLGTYTAQVKRLTGK